MSENTFTSSVSQDRLPIPGWEGRYEIDRQGNVYAMFPFKHLKPGRINKNRVNPDGYVTTTLSKQGQGKIRTIHRLLMLTFCPIENSDELEVNHIDLDKGNNDLKNLEWLTHHANIQHARNAPQKWAHHRGESVGGSKFNPDIVREIRRLYAEGKTQRELATLHNVSTMAIWEIVYRRSWAHVE